MDKNKSGRKEDQAILNWCAEQRKCENEIRYS